MSKFFKTSGLLDPVQESLPADVWSLSTSEPILRPELKTQILNKLYTVIPKGSVKLVSIIGSITGHKWTDTSDIDINVHVYPFNAARAKTNVTREINGFLAEGTRHPVNFFIQEWRPNLTWQDSFFGVYSVLEDQWAVAPAPRDNIRDPKVQFATEQAYARRISRNFVRVAQKYNKIKCQLHCAQMSCSCSWMMQWYITHKRAELKNSLKELIEFVDTIDAGRKLAYRTGWGIPRKSQRNIIFKMIEHGPYGDLFKKIEPLSPKDIGG